MKPKTRILLALAVLLLLSAAPCLAQGSTGSMAGTVLDPQGAVVPGADLTAKNEQNGAVFKTISSDAGLYVFPNLPVGTYTVTAELAGFKKLVHSGIEVRVAKREALDVRLEIGGADQTVEVSGEPPVLSANTSEIAQNFTPTFMNNLPLFSGGIRNPEAFIAYMPGVNNGSGDSSINGGSRRSKEVLIDGASQTIPESGGVVFNFPAAEQFGEFRLLTNNFSAEYGRTGGGIEIFLTKSGNNELHASFFYNLRNQNLNANSWANNAAKRVKPKERYNETGGAVGGPVYIPKVYDGRNKTFFYVTYVKDVRAGSVSASLISAPTAKMKQGDFSEVPQLIYDPATTVGNTRQAFANNKIPSNRISAISAKILPLIPDPTVAGIQNNYNIVNVSSLDRYIWSFKIDHAFTDKNRLSFYFSQEYNNTLQPALGFPGPLSWGLSDQMQKPENYRFNHDYIFGPTLVLHSTFGFTRQQQYWDNKDQKGWGSKLGLENTARGDADAFPYVTFTGPNSPSDLAATNGQKNVGSQLNWTFHFNQGLSWIRNRHEFKIGWDFRRMRTFSDPLDFAGSQGRFTFSNAQTALPTALSTTGNSFASFLLGTLHTANREVNALNPDDYSGYGYQAFFINDNWKVSSKLTLNLGLRFDVPLARFNSKGQFTSFDPTLSNPKADNRPGALAFTGFGPGRQNKKRFADIDMTEFGPRLGFAYQFNSKTVLRGGFGIYYGAGNHTTGGFCMICASGFTSRPVNQSADGYTPAFNWDSGFVFPAGYMAPPFIDPSFANGQDIYYLGPRSGMQPRFKNWNLNLQKELAHSIVIDVAWVGMRGTNLNSTVQMNQLDPKYLSLGSLLGKSITDPAVIAAGYTKPYSSFTGTLAQSLRPYPQFLAVSDYYGALGKSWYDALQLKMEKRYGSWQSMVAYTWSKTMSLGNYSQTAGQEEPQNSYDLAAEKNLQRFDWPHVFNLLNSFDLPFGKGKKFLGDTNPFLMKMVGGWTVAATQQYRSSSLLALSATNTLGAGVIFTNFKRGNTTGQDISTNTKRTDLDPNNPNTRWLNPAAFSVPGQYEFGTASRYNTEMRNPPVFSENLAIVKRTALVTIKEQPITMEYRADFFNVFNRTCFGGIASALGNANFGRPTGPQVGARIITMGLKVMW
jgi:hypothetical protein